MAHWRFRRWLIALYFITSAHGYAPPPLRPRPAPPSRRLTRYAAPTRSSDAQKAVSTLAFVTAAWGTQHSVAKAALDSVGDGHALELTAARFLVAALALAKFRPKDEETWRWGCELCVWSFLGFALQTIGLETTTATRSAFLLYLNVKFVPLLELVNGKTLPRGTWLSAVAALSGTLLLAADSDTIGSSWAPGDTFSVLAALASACFIVRLGPASQKASSAEGLASATALSTSLLAFLAFWQTGRFEGQGFVLPPSEVLVAALYLGLVPSALCGYLQTVAQRTVPPSSAAVVYATDPLWAAFFAYFALNERLGPAGLAGAALIAAAAFGQNLLLRDCDVSDEECEVD
jgi:drug/metabolite transporter (DMT)-like permease